MRIGRIKFFSSTNNKVMLDRLIDKLEKNHIEDYEIVSEVPRDVISVLGNLNSIKIFIPMDLEYSQYDIDDYIRSIKPYFRTSVTLERNIYVMKLSGSLSLDQFYKLIKYIIELDDFCAIIDN